MKIWHKGDTLRRIILQFITYFFEDCFIPLRRFFYSPSRLPLLLFDFGLLGVKERRTRVKENDKKSRPINQSSDESLDILVIIIQFPI